MGTFTSLLIALAILLVATAGLVEHDLAEGSSFASPEAEVRAALTSDPSNSAKELAWRGSLLDVYRQRGFSPLWFAGSHPTQQAMEMAPELHRAEGRGLLSRDYPAEPLQALLDARSERLAAAGTAAVGDYSSDRLLALEQTDTARKVVEVGVSGVRGHERP